jgi:kinesin family member 2/24
VTGPQFLRLSAEDIENRCLAAPGVSVEQAKAVHSKLWKMHIDSQHAIRSSDPTTGDNRGRGQSTFKSKSSSQNEHPSAANVPFTKRILPGMVVRWSKSTRRDDNAAESDKQQLAVVLCPAGSVGENVRYVLQSATFIENSEPEAAPTNQGSPNSKAWLCAKASPGLLPGSYEVHLWQHVVLDASMMIDEVILEYDTNTRYYHVLI